MDGKWTDERNIASSKMHAKSFLDLPAELRNTVYLQASEIDILVVDHKKCHLDHHFSPRYYGQDLASNVPGFLLANKQIYNEAAQVVYATATFCFDAHDHGFYHKWVKNLRPEHAKLVTKIRLFTTEQDWRRGNYGEYIHESAELMQRLLVKAKNVMRLGVDIQIQFWKRKESVHFSRISDIRLSQVYQSHATGAKLVSQWTREPRRDLEEEHERVTASIDECRRREYIEAQQRIARLGQIIEASRP